MLELIYDVSCDGLGVVTSNASEDDSESDRVFFP